MPQTGRQPESSYSCRHVRDVSAEALCAGFHKPFRGNQRSCPQIARERPAAYSARIARLGADRVGLPRNVRTYSVSATS